MSEILDKPRLADRTEAILRSDRQALRRKGPKPRDPAILLTLVPDNSAVIRLMDAYMPLVAEAAGLDYVRLVGGRTDQIAEHTLARTFLLLADLTGGDESVAALVSQALGQGRRVILAARDAAEVPPQLVGVPYIRYGQGPGEFDQLLRTIRQATVSTMDDHVRLA